LGKFCGGKNKYKLIIFLNISHSGFSTILNLPSAGGDGSDGRVNTSESIEDDIKNHLGNLNHFDTFKN
jgi:hypothetical protein